MTQIAVWHGSEEQILTLLKAVEHNCECIRGHAYDVLTTCSAHKMLAVDQRALDGLLFVCGLARQLREEEWSTRAPVGT